MSFEDWDLLTAQFENACIFWQEQARQYKEENREYNGDLFPSLPERS